jgi:hypothetical protein
MRIERNGKKVVRILEKSDQELLKSCDTLPVTLANLNTKLNLILSVLFVYEDQTEGGGMIDKPGIGTNPGV